MRKLKKLRYLFLKNSLYNSWRKQNQDYMNYVQIMSTGNAIDFGDLIRVISSVQGGSNGHGGLG